MDSLVSITASHFCPPPLPDTDTTFWDTCRTVFFKDVQSMVYERFLETSIQRHSECGHKHKLTIEETAAVVLYTWDFNQSGVVSPYQRLNRGCAERALDPRFLSFYWNLVGAYRKLPKVTIKELYRGLSTCVASGSVGGTSSYRAGKDVCIVAFTSTSKQPDKAKGFMPSDNAGGV
eukprot:PhF_6_TR22991/c0_g1_i1/m.32499